MCATGFSVVGRNIHFSYRPDGCALCQRLTAKSPSTRKSHILPTVGFRPDCCKLELEPLTHHHEDQHPLRRVIVRNELCLFRSSFHNVRVADCRFLHRLAQDGDHLQSTRSTDNSQCSMRFGTKHGQVVSVAEDIGTSNTNMCRERRRAVGLPKI